MPARQEPGSFEGEFLHSLIDMETEEDPYIDLLGSKSEDANEAATKITIDSEHFQPSR